MKKIRLCSTFNTVDASAGNNEDTLDINSIFWNHLFSSKSVRSLFDEYINKYHPSDQLKVYLDFIVDNLDTISLIKKDIFFLPFEEKRVLYCFKIYFFILSIYNKMNNDYQISLPYGVIFNHPLKNIEKFLSFDGKNILHNIFSEIFNNDDFFKNNTKYVIKVYWENESYPLLLLAHMMRNKFDNIEISVDLGNVNEQADFSFWKKQDLFNKYIDNFENIYHEDASQCKSDKSNRTVNVGYYGSKGMSTRLFDTKCYWGKCSFCSINSRFTSEKRVEGLSEHAMQTVDNLMNDIKKVKNLSSLVFMDEAIEASILIYFAEQLLKNNILGIKWSVRSRFSDKFTFTNCKILAKSGLRFLGFGLESVNQRILKLMNKREREYPKEELNNIFENCDNADINAHAYFMIGFPSETKQETNETLEFIDYQLKNRKYFTYSANVFYLMKGSDVHNSPKEYNITINDKYEGSKLSNIDFIDNGSGNKYTRDELAYLSRKSYSKMFFEEDDLDYATVQLGYHFWDFLDRTTIFYAHKLVNSHNPYLYRPSVASLTDEILNQNFKLLPLFVSSSDSSCEYHNVLNEKMVIIHDDIKDMFIFFINNFNTDITLRDNIQHCYDEFNITESEKGQDVLQLVADFGKQDMFKKYVIKLINDSLLYTSV